MTPPTIKRISCLSYDFAKRLTSPTNILLRNLKNYLNEYRLLTDEVLIDDGKIKTNLIEM